MDEFQPRRRRGRLKLFLVPVFLVVASGLLASKYFDSLPPQVQKYLHFLK